MPSRMTPEQLARAKAPGENARRAQDLARKVMSGNTGDSQRAADDLIKEFGPKEAKKIINTEVKRNAPKGGTGFLSRFRG